MRDYTKYDVAILVLSSETYKRFIIGKRNHNFVNGNETTIQNILAMLRAPVPSTPGHKVALVLFPNTFTIPDNWDGEIAELVERGVAVFEEEYTLW